MNAKQLPVIVRKTVKRSAPCPVPGYDNDVFSLYSCVVVISEDLPHSPYKGMADHGIALTVADRDPDPVGIRAIVFHIHHKIPAGLSGARIPHAPEILILFNGRKIFHRK